MIKNKRGEVTWSQIFGIIMLVIILGLAGYYLYKTNFFGNLNIISSSNVNTIKTTCEGYCQNPNSKYNYCCDIQEIIYSKDQKNAVLNTCDGAKSQLALEGCSFLCDVNTDCSTLICKGGTAKTKCDSGETKDTTKKFDESGVIIPSGSICCLSGTTNTYCSQQIGTSASGKAVPCLAAKCVQADIISGTFTDVSSGMVCCKKCV